MQRLPCELTSFISQDGLTTNYPNHLLMTLDEMHESMEQTHYRYGFQGMNGRSWSRIGTIFDLVEKFFSLDKDRKLFSEWLVKVGKVDEENADICWGVLAQKYFFQN